MMPSAASPIWLTTSSSVKLPSAINLMPDLLRPRSTNWRMKIGPTPAGTNPIRASGFASATRCSAGAKSLLDNGTRKDSITSGVVVVQRRREIVAGQWHSQGFDHLATGSLEAPLESGLDVDPGCVV